MLLRLAFRQWASATAAAASSQLPPGNETIMRGQRLQQFSPAGHGSRLPQHPPGEGIVIFSSCHVSTKTGGQQLLPLLKFGCGLISGETCRRLFLLPWRRQPHSLPVPPHSFTVPIFSSQVGANVWR